MNAVIAAPGLFVVAEYLRAGFSHRGIPRDTITTAVANDDVFDIDLQPGQASIHHTLTLHRSGPNNSNDWRLGVGLNYVSSQVGPLPGYEDSAMPLRGNVETSRFVFTQPPRSDLDSAALESFEAAIRLQSKRYSDVENN